MKCDKAHRLTYTEKAQKLVDQMTLEEKVHLMSGWVMPEGGGPPFTTEHYNFKPYPAAGNERLGLPPMMFCDGPRGVVCGEGKSTCFPVSMLRGASFDSELEEEIGRAIGRETRGHGGNLFAGVCINLPYNPGWGRSQETYGEESFAIGQMGSALLRGVQDENVMACVKHFAFNSMEISRFKCSVDCDRRTEREVYLGHFKDCVDAGAASIMSAYNLYKGVQCGHSDYLLRKVLKEEWDFDGFVMSDFGLGIRETVAAANGSQDMEMANEEHFGAKLVQAVRDGLVSERRINEAALRITRTILAFEEAYKASGKNYGLEVLGMPEHLALALRSAREGMTLIQNKGLLPLDRQKTKKLALIGKLANRLNIGDYGSSRVYPAYVVTPLEGITKAAPDTTVTFCDGSDFVAAKKAAREADAVIFVLGLDYNDEGEFIEFMGSGAGNFESEGGDRKDSLGLHTDELELLHAVAPENENSAVVLIGGNMLMITDWMDKVNSILMAYYPGQEGGTALGEIIFGDVNPSGKLPFVLPYKERDLPQVNWNTTNQWYDYYHGYTKLDKEGVKPLRPYGFGLSYTTFACCNASFKAKDEKIVGCCDIKNTGSREGTEVVQLYIGFKNSVVDRPVKLLRGFMRVTLKPGEEKRVEIACPVEKLGWFNPKSGAMEVENIEYEGYIGTSAAEENLLQGHFRLN